MKTTTLAIIFLSWISLNGIASSDVAAGNTNKFNDNILFSPGITAADVTKYLEDHGYTVESTPAKDGDYDWTCYTSISGNNYFTTVHTDASNIIFHEDVRL